MSIEQKAREIADEAYDTRGSDFKWQNVAIEAARLGIIEGLEMAAKWHDEQAKTHDDQAVRAWDDNAAEKAHRQRAEQHRSYAAAVRALIEEQKV